MYVYAVMLSSYLLQTKWFSSVTYFSLFHKQASTAQITNVYFWPKLSKIWLVRRLCSARHGIPVIPFSLQAEQLIKREPSPWFQGKPVHGIQLRSTKGDDPGWRSSTRKITQEDLRKITLLSVSSSKMISYVSNQLLLAILLIGGKKPQPTVN